MREFLRLYFSDNTQLNAPTSVGDVIATDDVGGIKHQLVKVEFGPDGSATRVAPGSPLPVDPSGVTSPVSVSNFPATQPVSGTMTANAGTNLNTSLLALESGGHLASLDTKLPVQGQALSAASMPVVLPAAQITTLTPPAAITNFANETGGNLAAIKADVDKIPPQGQALSAASMPVVLPATQITTLTPPAAITGFALEAGHLATIDSHIPAQGQALAAASMPVVLPAAQITTLTPPAAITGFALEAGHLANIDTHLDVALSTRLKPADTLAAVTTVAAVTAITNALPAGSNLLGKVGIDQTTPGTTNNVTVSSITPPTLTKATQGATGFSVQELKDAGRVSIMITANVASTAATETLITITKSAGLAATGTSTSTTITTGKRFRIQMITASARNSTGTTAGVATISIRAAVAGATTTASPLQFITSAALPASALSVNFPDMSIPDGFEIDSNGATNTYGITITHPQWVTGSVVATFTISIIGYEY